MQEFTSISVSSYEADTLTALLNEKSGDGWNVVTIVPTGSTVTAYLSKEKSEESAEAKSDESADAKPAVVQAAAASGATVAARDESKPVIDPVTVGAAAAAADAKDAADSADADADVGEPDKSPVDEPPGFAAAGNVAAGAGATAAAATPAATATPASTATAPATAAAATPAAAPAATPSATPAAATAAAPAGWYADPSSRYELRYWDGSQWTEHVSRAGQQFTDPPVA